MKYILGIDGGGTKTSICIEDMEQKNREIFYSGAFNINGQGEEQTKNTLEDINKNIKELGYKIEECVGIGVGAAGISNPKVSAFLNKELKNLGYLCPIVLCGDQETALLAAFESGMGIVLIAGTGSICFGKENKNQFVRAGGYGHLIDDVGSGYAIAKDILTAIVRAEDERGEKTILTSLIFEQLGINTIEELLQFLYRQGRSKKEMADLAVVIEKAVSCGDKIAILIEEKSANDLYSLFEAVKKKMPKEINLVLSGSVLTKNKRICSLLIEKIHRKYPEMNIVISKEESAVGALQLVRAYMEERANGAISVN